MKIQFNYDAHPHIVERKKHKPTKVKDKDAAVGFNAKLAIILTTAVGTMWCAYFFAILALVVLPDAIKGGMLTTIQWVSQTFIQLVMLSVIMVGQNIMGKASDKRAELTYNDADATFHEACEIQKHLLDQDAALNEMMSKLLKMEEALNAREAKLDLEEGK